VASDDRYFVYILSNASRTLYIGVTNDLVPSACQATARRRGRRGRPQDDVFGV